MANELRIHDGWYEYQLMPRVNDLVMKATVAVRDDAREICPVDTGELKASLVALNSGIGEGRVASHVPYCAAVELGFHGLEYVREHERQGRPVRSHVRRGNSPEQPFLRPALYRVRDLGSL